MNIPWVEKYRPTDFDSIILHDFNREILKNTIEKNYFPNMIFHGPPGTGKTTTIINLINIYNNKYNNNNNNLIHLNASDERGIETIRTLIYNFINSKNMFSKNNIKFVILDEVDCITKVAQQALKYIIQINNNKNVRFCLVCNYISKIEYNLQNEFVKIRFTKLPEEKIINFLSKINKEENLNYKLSELKEIQRYFNSDIRCMINFIQNNYHNKLKLIDDNILNQIYILNIDLYTSTNKIKFVNYIYFISTQFNKNILDIIELYLKYIIIDKSITNNQIFNILEKILHNEDKDIELYLNLIYLIINKYKII